MEEAEGQPGAMPRNAGPVYQGVSGLHQAALPALEEVDSWFLVIALMSLSFRELSDHVERGGD